jgi:tRNA U34 5-methylaminomethyl-2-thiouridine-forming methyltransferase MnmC
VEQRELRKTGDGSVTFYLPEYDEHFHSHHGAYIESMHVFIQNGLEVIQSKKNSFSILEMGMGTGLNVLLSILHRNPGSVVHYTALELFPLSKEEYSQLDYTNIHGLEESAEILRAIHDASWEEEVEIFPDFYLHKKAASLFDFQIKDEFDLVYYDAFAPRVQPDLWTVDAFQIVANALRPGGLLTTYCVQGAARRAMVEVGLIVEKIPGPPGKREMAWARKK